VPSFVTAPPEQHERFNTGSGNGLPFIPLVPRFGHRFDEFGQEVFAHRSDLRATDVAESEVLGQYLRRKVGFHPSCFGGAEFHRKGSKFSGTGERVFCGTGDRTSDAELHLRFDIGIWHPRFVDQFPDPLAHT